jgi:hypothetical protein
MHCRAVVCTLDVELLGWLVDCFNHQADVLLDGNSKGEVHHTWFCGSTRAFGSCSARTLGQSIGCGRLHKTNRLPATDEPIPVVRCILVSRARNWVGTTSEDKSMRKSSKLRTSAGFPSPGFPRANSGAHGCNLEGTAQKLHPHTFRPTYKLIDLHLAQQLVSTVQRFAPGASPHVLLPHRLRRLLTGDQLRCLLVVNFSNCPDACFARCHLIRTPFLFGHGRKLSSDTADAGIWDLDFSFLTRHGGSGSLSSLSELLLMVSANAGARAAAAGNNKWPGGL